MPTVYETKTGKPISFTVNNFLLSDDSTLSDVELFPHFMLPILMTPFTMYEVATKIRALFLDDNSVDVTIHSTVNGNIYRRSKYLPRKEEQHIFSNIVIMTFRTKGHDYNGNSLCKGSEEWATPAIQSSTQCERLYTYAIYSDNTGSTPQSFMSPINIPFFYDPDDPKPLTKTNVPKLFSTITRFLKRRLKVYDERCIRLQRIVDVETDVPPQNDFIARNQITAFRMLWSQNLKKLTPEFKEYIDSIENKFYEQTI